MLVFWPRPVDRAGVAIEMKRARGGRLSDDQRWWHEQLSAAGWAVVVARGASDAVAALAEIGLPLDAPTRVPPVLEARWGRCAPSPEALQHPLPLRRPVAAGADSYGAEGVKRG